MKFTKGPWKLGSPSGMQDSNGKWVTKYYSVFCGDETQTVGPSSVAYCKEADALLIAAAPDLHEVVSQLAQFDLTTGPLSEVIDKFQTLQRQAREALKKAGSQ